MKRRAVLAAAGAVGALGLAGCISGGGAGPARTDEETETPTATDTPTGTAPTTPSDPQAAPAIGDESTVLLPDENRPHGLTLRNAADETRELGVRIASDGSTRFEESWSLGGGEAVALTLVEPAAYAVTVSIDGEAAGDVTVGLGRFDCNASRTTVEVLPDGTLDDTVVSTLVACGSPIAAEPDFEVTESGCGTDQGATVTFDDRSVAITGAIAAPNPCHGAEIAGAAWDGEAERLTLTVATTEPVEDEVCVDCVGAVEYEARITFADAPPAVVAVEHEHWDRTETVATARR